MERTAAHVPAARTAHDHRARQECAIARRRHVVREHVVRVGEKVDELHLDHWPHAHVGRARRRADNADLGDRRVDDALLTELVEQSFRDLERAAVLADVFAETKHVLVAFHFLEQRLADRLEIGDLGHQCFSLACDGNVPHPSGRSCASTTLDMPSRNHSGFSDGGSA